MREVAWIGASLVFNFSVWQAVIRQDGKMLGASWPTDLMSLPFLFLFLIRMQLFSPAFCCYVRCFVKFIYCGVGEACVTVFLWRSEGLSEVRLAVISEVVCLECSSSVQIRFTVCDYNCGRGMTQHRTHDETTV